MRAIVVVLALLGCGRIDFDRLPTDGATDANGDGTVVPLCPPSALLCDGFESGDFSRWDFVRLTPGSTAEVNNLRVHSGALAYEALVPPGSDGDNSCLCKQFPARSSGTVAVRAWIYSPQPLTNFDTILLWTNAGTCSAGGASAYAAAACNGSGNWVVTELSGADHEGAPCLSVDTWTCVELDYTFGSPARIQLYVGDTIVVDAAAADANAALDRIRVGIPRADAAGYHAFIDDVVVGTEHIGCQ